MNYILQLDTNLFLLINGCHNNFFDFVMYWVSSKTLWIPLWLYFIFLLIKIKGLKNGAILILVLIFAVSVADLISVHCFKNVFQRLRPCHNENLMGMVHTLNGYCGGKYGFVSSHATNMFAIATFMFLAIKEKFPKSYFLLISWALLIAYSRIYLGVHYPADVLCGGILGATIACGCWFGLKFIKPEKPNLT